MPSKAFTDLLQVGSKEIQEKETPLTPERNCSFRRAAVVIDGQRLALLVRTSDYVASDLRSYESRNGVCRFRGHNASM